MRMQTSLPARKVTAATAGAALAELGVGLLQMMWPDLAMPPTVQSSLTVLLVFLAGYITPPAQRDQIVEPG